MTNQVWRRKYELGLQFIRWFLAVTFVAVVIATLTECQPFTHYWQVVPDPGAKCRQGYAQLITMGTSDVITDLLLVAFPIPIVLKSHMATKRKISLVLLFSLSLILIGITVYRVIQVIDRHSDQQFRSLVASLEILAAAAVANALVLGSFVRDRGVKKQRYRFGSAGGNSSLDRAGAATRPRALTVQAWGSDADLAGELCMRMVPDLEQQTKTTYPKPAPLALPPASHAKNLMPKPKIARSDWGSPIRDSGEGSDTDLKEGLDAGGVVEKPPPSPGESEVTTPRRVSFFDVGGLLGADEIAIARRSRPKQTIPEMTPGSLPADGPRRGSNASPSDVRGINPPQLHQAPAVRNFSRSTSRTMYDIQQIPEIQKSIMSSSPRSMVQGHSSPQLAPDPVSSSSLRDVGGLLG